MKKLFALLLALCMVFALCACGQQAASQPEESKAPEAETPAENTPAENTEKAPRRAREFYPQFPKNLYVVEELRFDHVLTVQRLVGKELIETTILELLEEKSIEQISVAEIAENSGISTRGAAWTRSAGSDS